LIVACLLISGCGWSTMIHGQSPDQTRPEIVVSQRAIDLHRSSPVIDGHNDLPWALREAGGSFDRYDIRLHQPKFHTDLTRLATGGVGAQFWSVYVPADTSSRGNALAVTLEQIGLVKEMSRRYSDSLELATSTGDIARIREQGKIACLIGVEGGHSIEGSINVLRQLYREGARYMTLTHSMSLDWADSCGDKAVCGGLSDFGCEIVAEMNRLGMIVDISHVSDNCMRQTLNVTKAPVVFSHSSARGIADHPRNVPDDVLRMTKANGGVVMINFYPDFVHPRDAQRSRMRSEVQSQLKSQYPNDGEQVAAELRKWEASNPRCGECTVHDVLDHIDHVVKVAGIDHVGLGSDFDGVPSLPKQLDDVSKYPVITQGMIDRGYSDDQIRKVLGENVLRVFRDVEQAATVSGG
jgi:membrane dipeptidase